MSTIKRLRFLFVLFIFISVFSFSTEAFAATVVSGDIGTDPTWTLDQSPYLVENDITVFPGATLTIQAGVAVKFANGSSLFVDGILNAYGASTQPIYFTSSADDSVGGDTNNDDEEFCSSELDDEGNIVAEFCESLEYEPYEGDWGGLIFGSKDQSVFNHVISRYSSDGIVFYNGGSIVSDFLDSDEGITLIGSNSSFKNLIIPDINILNGSVVSIDGAVISSQDAYGSPLQVFTNSSLNLKNAVIESNNYSDVVYIFENSSAIFESVNIASNLSWGAGIYVFNNSSLDLSKSFILDAENGIEIFNNSSVTISDSSMICENNGVAAHDDAVLNLRGGSIACGNHGIILYGDVNAEISGVKVSNSSDAGIIAYGIGNVLPSQISITKSEITGNEYGFVVFNTAISAHQNNIHGNTVGAVSFNPLAPNQFDFTNNYWGDPTGPSHATNPAGLGNMVSDDILFTPFLASDPLAVECCSNVLFLPGLKASRLYKQKSILGIPVEDQLWEPNVNADVEDLYLNADGTSKNSNIYTKDIIKETNVPIPMGALGQNVYKSFSKMMEVLLDEHKIGEWKEFAYDWRQSVDDIVYNGTKYKNGNMSLVATLQSLIDSSKNGKVTIIAHSNGGLLAKALLKKLQDDKNAGRNNLIDSVDVLILVAVPEIGTAVAVPAMLHGYDQDILGGWIVDETRARELGRNMLGAFGLLPSKEYINHVSASPAAFSDNAIPSQVTTKLVKTFGGAINSYAEYKSFLSGGEGRTNPQSGQTNLPISLASSLFDKAETLHNDIDAFVPPASLRVIEVAGWGLDTVASFEYYPKECTTSLGCGFILDQRPKFTIDGDGTVVTPSAHYMGFIGSAEKYWVDFPNHNEQLILGLRRNREHKDILEVDSLNNFIQSILEKKDVIFDGVFKNSQPTGDSNRLRLSIHSPVTLDAYDVEGNHTGKICPPSSDFCYKEENIPNSSYLEFGEGKYLNLPEDKVKSIKLQGTDVGTFTYKSEKVLPGGTSTVSSFVDIPVTTQTQAEIVLNPTTQIPQLKIDVTGDGVNDFTLTPNAAFEPIVYLQIMKATIDSLDLPKAKIKAFNVRVDNIIKLIQKGKIDKAKLKADKFKSVLEKKLAKPDPKKPKPKKLSKTDAQLLLDMLNKLLDNIN